MSWGVYLTGKRKGGKKVRGEKKCKMEGENGDGGKRTVNILLDGLVGQDGAAVDVDFVPDGDVVAQHADVLEPGPLADGAVPADDGRLDPGVVLDLAAGQKHAALQPDAVADDDVGPDGDVGADAAVAANLGAGVDEDVAAVDPGGGGGRQFLGRLLGEGGEVETGAGEEILGLADVHPEAVEVEGVQLAVLADGREGFLFDGGGAELDTTEYGRVEDVDAGVDAVADELDRFFDEAVDAGGVVGLVDDDAVFGGFFDLGDDDGAFLTVGPVEVGQLAKGVFADDVRVENEEGRVVFAEDLLGQLERSGGAEGFGLDGEFNVDVVLILVLPAFHQLSHVFLGGGE